LRRQAKEGAICECAAQSHAQRLLFCFFRILCLPTRSCACANLWTKGRSLGVRGQRISGPPRSRVDLAPTCSTLPRQLEPR
jgi:hypothetical protein